MSSNYLLGRLVNLNELRQLITDRFAIVKRVYDVFTYIGIDPFVPITQFFAESRFTFYAYNEGSGAMGLGQQMPANIKGFGFPYNPKKCRPNQTVNPDAGLYGFEEHAANIDIHIQMYLNLLYTFSLATDYDIRRSNGKVHPVFGYLRAYAGGAGTYEYKCTKYHVRLFFRNFYFPKLMALYPYVRQYVTEILNRSDMVDIFNQSLTKIMNDFRANCPVQAEAGYKPFILEYINDQRTKVPSNLIDPTKANYFKNGVGPKLLSFEEYVNRIKSRLNSSPTLKALVDIARTNRENPITTYDIEVQNFREALDWASNNKCYHPESKYYKTLASYVGPPGVNEYMFYVYTIKPDFSGLIYEGKEYSFGGPLANGQFTPAVINYKPSGGGIGYSSGFSNCGCSGVGQAGCTPKEDDRVYSQGTNKAGCADCAKMLDSSPFNSTQFGSNCIGSSPDPTRSCPIESVNMQEYLKIFVGVENINENGDLNGELKMDEIKPYYFGIGVRCDKKELLYPKIPNVENLEQASVRYDNLNNLASFMNVHNRQNMVINCVTNIVIHATGTEAVPNPELLNTEKLLEGMRQISSYFILSPNNKYNQNPAGDKSITFIKFYSGRNKQEYQALNQPVKVENVKAFGNTENVKLLRGPSYHFIVKHYYGNEGVQLAELHDGITFEGEAIEDLVDILVPRKEHIIAISVPLLPNLYYDYLYGGPSDRDKIEKFIKKQGPSILPKYLTRAYATYRVDQENVANSSGDFVSMMTFPYGPNDKDFAGLAAVYEGEVNGNHVFSTGWIGNVNTHADHYSLSSISIVYVGGAIRNGSNLVNLPTLTEKQQRNLKLLVGKLMYAYRKFHKMKIRAMGHNQTGKSNTYCPSLWVPSFFQETGLLEELKKEFKESTMSILCSNDPMCMKKALYENHKKYASAKEISEKEYKKYYCYALGDDKIFKA